MKLTKRGYVLMYKPDHPFAQRGGWILDHRLKMEEHLGRYLTKAERVHHIDGDKTNNFISNLMLFPTHAEHIKYHATQEQWKARLIENGYKRVQTAATKEKCRVAKLGNKHCVGRVMSFETRKKIADGIRRHYATH